MNSLHRPAATLDLSSLAGSFAGQVLQRLQDRRRSGGAGGRLGARLAAWAGELHDLDLAVPPAGWRWPAGWPTPCTAPMCRWTPSATPAARCCSDPDGQPLFVDFAAWRGPSLADDLRQARFHHQRAGSPSAGRRGPIIDVTGGLADLEAPAAAHSLMRRPCATIRCAACGPCGCWRNCPPGDFV